MNFNSYLLTISLLILFVSLISILLPNGRLNKTVKVIFSLLIVLSIIKPIITLCSGENTSISLENDLISSDESVIDELNNRRIQLIKDEIDNIAKKYNLPNISCDLSSQFNYGKIFINKIKITINDKSFFLDKEHSNILEGFVSDISSTFNIDKSLVVIDE